jgi:hypothetical protein
VNSLGVNMSCGTFILEEARSCDTAPNNPCMILLFEIKFDGLR